jgi:hypothetical protein
MPVVFCSIPAVFCSTGASEVTLPGTVTTASPPPNCAEADMGMSRRPNRSPMAFSVFIDATVKVKHRAHHHYDDERSCDMYQGVALK